MSQRTNYSDFINFAKKHMDLSPTKIITEYRKQGGHVQKQNGLEVLRQSFGYDIGEKKGKTLREKVNNSKVKDYVFEPATKRKSAYEGKGKQKGSNNYIVYDKKHGVTYLDEKSRAVQHLRNKINNMYGIDSDKFIQIDITVHGDGYTEKNKFSVWIPFNGRNKQGVKTTGQKILQNLKTFYSNLARMYGKSPKAGMYSKLHDSMLDKLETLRKDLNRGRGLTHDDLIELFAKHGIELETFELIGFTKNERLLGSTRWKQEHKG